MKTILKAIILLAAVLLFSYCMDQSNPKEYPANIGDLEADLTIDDPEFKPCRDGRIPQHYVPHDDGRSVNYNGEKPAILAYFNNLPQYNYHGIITVRFIVNCHGKVGRLRPESMTYGYKQSVPTTELLKSLLEKIKNMDGWIPYKRKEIYYDHYQYLLFKFQNGILIEILP